MNACGNLVTMSDYESDQNEYDTPNSDGRIECSYKENVRISPSLNINYGCVTLRGYYPDDADKDNQDSHIEMPDFKGPPQDSGTVDGFQLKQAFFGVFDGHGSAGHHISRFTRDTLPAQLQKAIADHPNDFSSACREAFLRTDELVERAGTKGVMDDEMSGTTAVCVLVSHELLRVANVGDSRVIIGQRRADKIIAYPLSIDQTPYRQDEYYRTHACGARIMSGDQLDGLRPWYDDWEQDLTGQNDDESDPPRLWLAREDVPGCAFTRSVGDRLGKSIGVIALPELLDKEITTDDEYIVICSDGVFEFISNQMAMDMVVACGDPLVACHALVQEAYKLWLQFDVRTDDITAIVLKLEHLSDSSVSPDSSIQSGPKKSVFDPMEAFGGRRSSATSRRESFRKASSAVHAGNRRVSAMGVGTGLEVISGEHMRPVRRVASKEKRKIILSEGKSSMPDTPEVTRVDVQGNILEDDIDRVQKTVASNFLFANLDTEQQRAVCAEMESVLAPVGCIVIQQGERGDWFYVVDYGKLDVIVASTTVEGGRTVYTYDSSKAGPALSFGDLALLYQQARAGTIVAREDSKLWRLHRDVFRKRLQKASFTEQLAVLKKVEILQSLSISELQQLAESLAERTYAAGECVIEQGEVSSAFYVIRAGEAVVTKKENIDDQEEQPTELMRIGPSDYFGERALLNDAPRAATVRATSELEVLFIKREAFEMVLGPLDYMIDHDRRRREKKAYLHQLQAETTSLVTAGLSSFLLWPGQSLNDNLESWHICESLRTGKMHAICIWSKARIMEEMQETRVMNSAALYAGMKAPPCRLLPQPIALFEDAHRLFTVYSSRLVSDLGMIFDPTAPFDEDITIFYVGCILLALESLQYENVVLRSVCIEATSITADGLLQLTDMRIAKNLEKCDSGITYTLCGSPSYMAPEMVAAQGHGCEVDLWALGVMTYELLSGQLPFEGETELELYNRIRKHVGTTASLNPDATKGKILRFPSSFTEEAQDFIDVLLSTAPRDRYYSRGAGLEPLRQHMWFNDVNWEALGNGELQGPHYNILQARIGKMLNKARNMNLELYRRNVQAKEISSRADTKWCEDFDSMCRFYTCVNTRASATSGGT